MSYEKQTWDTTSYVNPTRMNKMEAGIQDASDRLAPVESDISDIKSYISDLTANTVGATVDLIGYTSSNKYTIPRDGYIYFNAMYTSTDEQAVIGISDNNSSEIGYIGVAGGSQWSTIFVKKGFKAFVALNIGNHLSQFKYIPLQ